MLILRRKADDNMIHGYSEKDEDLEIQELTNFDKPAALSSSRDPELFINLSFLYISTSFTK
jgi:hypothetical protein